MWTLFTTIPSPFPTPYTITAHILQAHSYKTQHIINQLLNYQKDNLLHNKDPSLAHTSLPCVSRFETFLQKPQQFDIAYKPPRRFVHEPWRNLPDKALDEQIRTETLQHIHEEVQILIEAESLEVLREFRIFLLHARALDYLKLMKLH